MVKAKANVRCYHSALAALGGRDAVRLAHNTRLVATTEGIELRLHGHAIVTYYPDGSVRLDSCGRMSMTTKARMNQFTRFGVLSHYGVWSMFNPASWPRHGCRFVNGMRITADGTVRYPFDCLTETRVRRLAPELTWNPDDKTDRAIVADWLEEHGHSALAAEVRPVPGAPAP